MAPIIISGAPVEVLAAWAVTRKEFVAGCFGLQAPDATSAALSNEFLAAIMPGPVNPATAEGKKQLIDQLVRARRQIVLGVGDSASDAPIWRAAEASVYIGTVITPYESTDSSLVVENPSGWEAADLLTWVHSRLKPWRLPTRSKDTPRP
jgi:hypothetical protein